MLHDYAVREMAELVCRKLNIQETAAVEEAVREYWADKIAAIWCIEDVYAEADSHGVK